jgi:hypothetical protein
VSFVIEKSHGKKETVGIHSQITPIIFHFIPEVSKMQPFRTSEARAPRFADGIKKSNVPVRYCSSRRCLRSDCSPSPADANAKWNYASKTN